MTDYEDELAEPTRECPRCGDEHLEGDFRGGVCGWCAEDLEGQR